MPAPPRISTNQVKRTRLRSLVEGAESRRADPEFRMGMGGAGAKSVHLADSQRTPSGHFADTSHLPAMTQYGEMCPGELGFRDT